MYPLDVRHYVLQLCKVMAVCGGLLYCAVHANQVQRPKYLDGMCARLETLDFRPKPSALSSIDMQPGQGGCDLR